MEAGVRSLSVSRTDARAPWQVLASSVRPWSLAFASGLVGQVRSRFCSSLPSPVEERPVCTWVGRPYPFHECIAVDSWLRSLAGPLRPRRHSAPRRRAGWRLPPPPYPSGHAPQRTTSRGAQHHGVVPVPDCLIYLGVDRCVSFPGKGIFPGYVHVYGVQTHLCVLRIGPACSSGRHPRTRLLRRPSHLCPGRRPRCSRSLLSRGGP